MKLNYLAYLSIALFMAVGILNTQTVKAKEVSARYHVKQKHVRALERIDSSLKSGDLEKASSQLDILSKKKDLNSTELAYIANYRANICFVRKDINCTTQEYERIVELKDSIAPNFYSSILKSLASVYFFEGEFAKTIALAKEYVGIRGHQDQQIHVLLAQAHHKNGNHAEALSHIRKRIDSVDIANVPIKSGWVFMMINLYKELGMMDEALAFVNSMTDVNSKTKYMIRIAELYGETGKNEEMKSINQRLIEEGKAGYRNGKLIPWQSEGVILPRYRPNLNYPSEAIRKKQEGWVDLMFDIDEEGKTQNIRITNTSEKKVFDDSAVQAAQGYLFDPIIKDGEPHLYKDYEMRIFFELNR